jgi:hypothetical protein
MEFDNPPFLSVFEIRYYLIFPFKLLTFISFLRSSFFNLSSLREPVIALNVLIFADYIILVSLFSTFISALRYYLNKTYRFLYIFFYLYTSFTLDLDHVPLS